MCVLRCRMRKGVEVGASDRARLEAIVADRNVRQKHVEPARIVLLTGDGVGTLAIRREVGCAKATVRRWQERFAAEGVGGLLRDKSRPPGKALPRTVVERLVELTLGEPPGEATPWTGRAMAAAAGMSLRSVQRIWRAHGLQPHRVKRFKLSKDPEFAAKLQDIDGLYVDPPAHAVVLSVGPRPAREKLACGMMRLLCGHVSGLLMRSSHDRWPRWVAQTRASSDPRDRDPSTSPGCSRSVGTNRSPHHVPSLASVTGQASSTYAGTACR